MKAARQPKAKCLGHLRTTLLSSNPFVILVASAPLLLQGSDVIVAMEKQVGISIFTTSRIRILYLGHGDMDGQYPPSPFSGFDPSSLDSPPPPSAIYHQYTEQKSRPNNCRTSGVDRRQHLVWSVRRWVVPLFLSMTFENYAL